MRAPISGEAATPPFRTPARSVAVWSLHSSRAVTSPMGPDAAGWACRCQCDWPSLRSAGAGGWCMSSSDRGSGLYGRGGQCDLLDRLLAATQAGESQVLVVRGEAGIGKTALLDYVAQRASGCSVPSCSSARTRSSGTCARCSPSSGSDRADSSVLRWPKVPLPSCWIRNAAAPGYACSRFGGIRYVACCRDE